jgi:hypothetical protein
MTVGALICWLARTALMVPASACWRTRLSRHRGAFIAGLCVAEPRFRARPCQSGKRRSSAAGKEVLARPHAMETDERYEPLHKGALGVHGAVVVTEYLSDFIQEFGLWILRRGGPIILSRCCPKIADNTHRAKLPENHSNIILSGLWGAFDTAGEVIFVTASTPTHQVFNGLPHMNRAYCRLRQQYQSCLSAGGEFTRPCLANTSSAGHQGRVAQRRRPSMR